MTFIIVGKEKIRQIKIYSFHIKPLMYQATTPSITFSFTDRPPEILVIAYFFHDHCLLVSVALSMVANVITA